MGKLMILVRRQEERRAKMAGTHVIADDRRASRKVSGTTAAYAFTDYRSQGQTIIYVIVDIASPPSGSLSLFNLYVALSRSSGRETIRLLRDFDDQLFQKEHDQALIREDARLETLDGETRLWYENVVLLKNG